MSRAATIAALATPPGCGGVAVIRISGPNVPEIARVVLDGLPTPRVATRHLFRDNTGAAIDDGLAVFFPAPHSFTGEHVLELHTHGAPVVVDLLLKHLLTLGARLARPGEFSERAFLNGKLDLAQAEAIVDLINAGTEAAARSALRSLTGEFSRRVHAITDALIQLRTYVEAAIDFPEEEIDFLSDQRVIVDLASIVDQVHALRQNAQQGQLLQAGMTLVLAGAPNSGKSSLLNALAHEDAAIVSPTPGTTRDVVQTRIEIDGMPIHVLDTAGLRVSTDPIEQEGIARAHAAIARADRVLFVIDDSNPQSDEIDSLRKQLPSNVGCTIVYNKIDLTGRNPGLYREHEQSAVAVSAKTHTGLDDLKNHLKYCVGFEPNAEGGFIARRRHVEALDRASRHLEYAQTQLTQHRAGELLAEELRLTQQALGEITGEFSSEDLLARIFSSFCIGK